MWLWALQLVATAGALTCSDTEYLSNEQLLSRLESLAEDNHDIASIYTIGVSQLGTQLRVLKLTAGSEYDRLPKVKFVGGIHGNEPPSSHVLLNFAEELVRGYRSGERYITWLLKNTRIHILPRLNPDGFTEALEGDCDGGKGRRNSNRVDLNRDFPGVEEDGPPVQPEVASVVDWSEAERFTLSASLHTGSLVAVYPLDSPILPSDPSGKTTDEDVFLELARTYASTHRTMASGHSCPGKHPFPGGVVNGADWYKAKGTMMDFNYLIVGTMELTLEVSCCKYPHPRFLCPIWEQNRMALLKFAGQAVRGVRGTVTSSGIPVENASVKVYGKDMPVYTNSRGEFFRILLPGTYTLLVEMIGMESFEVEVVVPRPDTAFLTWAEVSVELIPQLVDSFSPLVDRGGLDPEASTQGSSYLLSRSSSEGTEQATHSGSKEQQNTLFSQSSTELTNQDWLLTEEDRDVMKALNDSAPRTGNLVPNEAPCATPLIFSLVCAISLLLGIP